MCQSTRTMLVVFCVGLILAMMSQTGAGVLSTYACTQASDCNSDECCAIGMQRYSIPSCRKFQAEGESCRIPSYPEPRNFTVVYPNGERLEAKEVYTLMCPCDPSFGLNCVQGECHQVSYLDTGNNL